MALVGCSAPQALSKKLESEPKLERLARADGYRELSVGQSTSEAMRHATACFDPPGYTGMQDDTGVVIMVFNYHDPWGGMVVLHFTPDGTLDWWRRLVGVPNEI